MAALCAMADEMPRGYSEPGTCAPCHAEIAASYASTPMARTFGALAAPARLPPLKSFSHAPSGQTFTTVQRGPKTFLRRQEEAGRHSLEKSIDYWIGSGNHAQSYASRTAAGDLIELPVTWYAERQGYWAMSPAYDSPQHAGFSRKITYRCMFCHNAYPALPAGSHRSDNASRWPETLPSGIDCQRCHGPGQAHIDAARKSQTPADIRSAITNPARLAPERRTEVCLQCHLETTNNPLPGFLKAPDREVFSYQPGQPLAEYVLHFDHAPGTGHEDKFQFASAPYRLRQSECFSKSEGQLTCTTCHTPHRTTTNAEYDQACRTCHVALEEQHRSRVNCAGCHMPPRRADDAVHVTITDHRIVRKPEPLINSKREKKAESTTPYRGPVVLYYPKTIGDPAKRDLALAVAQVVDQSNLAFGTVDLERAIARWKPTLSYYYSILGNSHRALGQDPRAAYRAALGLDSSDVAALFALGGEANLRQALRLAPWNTEIHKKLARLLTDAGRLQEAVELLRASVKVDPDAADLHNSLGLSLLRLGAFGEAETSLREAVRLRPESPAMRVNLATVLANRREWPEARYEFDRALALGPREEIHLAYGAALAAEGDVEAAIAQYRSAIRLNAKSARAHYALALLLARSRPGDEWREVMLKASQLARDANMHDVLAAAEKALNSGRPREVR